MGYDFVLMINEMSKLMHLDIVGDIRNMKQIKLGSVTFCDTATYYHDRLETLASAFGCSHRKSSYDCAKLTQRYFETEL